ncbi:small nuclear ribonucleoprotein Sm D3 [Mycoemilia scoparia]|uniref:Small nuclear ribonucleoprotein Sm D3 n=1 Tax=Mycoemilia scoparia TaxID=417184 RepID=A0A9W8AAY6_9FUNG|nr:small nuclear ribonucleoprotein Sm D3 [Mycoemilia scoparia]
MSVGVPIKLLHEVVGHIVTIELKTGQEYRGTVIDTEDNMNVQLKNIEVRHRDGRKSKMERVYIRGSTIRYFVIPDIFKNAPMVKNMDPANAKARGIGMGRGKLNIARAQARGRGRGGFRGRPSYHS